MLNLNRKKDFAAVLEGDLLTSVKRVRDEVLPKMGLDAKALFTAMYNALINKDQGPRLGNFMRIIGKDDLNKILSVC